MVPLRSVFRNRWWTLAWAAGILFTAISFASSESHDFVDAANSADSNAAVNSALAAEQ